MSETDDAREQLADKDVAKRAVAARWLSHHGDASDLEGLLKIATTDKSPSIRIYTAAAAADILHRLRSTSGLEPTTIDAVIAALRAFDPQGNPSVMMVLGALGKPVRGRLGRLLRDPHSDVRLAAVAAIRREALSPLSMDDDGLADDVLGWLGGRLPADATLELAALVGEAGWRRGAEVLRSVLPKVRDPEGRVGEAMRRLRERDEFASWVGAWVEQEPGLLSPPEPSPDRRWIGVHPNGWFAGGADTPCGLSEGRLNSPQGPARLLHVAVPGQPTVPMIQTASDSWFRIEDKALAKWVEAQIDALAGSPGLCAALLPQLAEVEGAVAPRARALLAWRAGDIGEAARALDALLEAKKPRPDLLWWRANVALSEGDLDLARERVSDYLQAAPKKAAFIEDAEALQASLAIR